MSESVDASPVAEDVLSDEMHFEDVQGLGDTPQVVVGSSSELMPSAETPEMFSNNEDANDVDNPVPAELQDLVSLTGVRLVWCENTWSVDG